MSNVYVIERQPSGVTITAPDGRQLTPIPVHSPTGFDFGYLGSGPAETACVILREFFARRWGCDPENVSPPAPIYHEFKREVIAQLKRSVPRHEIAEDDIATWLRGKRGLLSFVPQYT